MACGYGACYGCVGRDRRRAEAPLRRRAGALLLLNASGCLDALTAPDVARAARRVRDEDGHAAAARGQRADADRRDRRRDAQLDRPREPGHRPRSSPRPCRGSRELGVPRLGLRRRLRGRRLRRDLRAPRRSRRGRARSSSTSRARTSKRRRRRAAQIVAAAARATRKPLYAKLSPAVWDIAEVARAVAGGGRRRPLAREHDPRPRARRAHARARARAGARWATPARR